MNKHLEVILKFYEVDTVEEFISIQNRKNPDNKITKEKLIIMCEEIDRLSKEIYKNATLFGIVNKNIKV